MHIIGIGGINDMIFFGNKQNAIVHVLCNDTNETTIPQECRKVKTEIDEIKGIKESFFTKESKVSNIVAYAEWNEDEIESKTEEIRNISNVKSVKTHILVPA